MSRHKSSLRLTHSIALDSIASKFELDLMKREKKDKKETLNFRVSAEFKQRLIEEAGKERRSLTNYLETTLTRLWDEGEAGAEKARTVRRN